MQHDSSELASSSRRSHPAHLYNTSPSSSMQLDSESFDVKFGDAIDHHDHDHDDLDYSHKHQAKDTSAKIPKTRCRKRKQVKRACSNCRKAHSACGKQRPCPRCVLRKEEHKCVDTPRKKRIIENEDGVAVGYDQDSNGPASSPPPSSDDDTEPVSSPKSATIASIASPATKPRRAYKRRRTLQQPNQQKFLREDDFDSQQEQQYKPVTRSSIKRERDVAVDSYAPANQQLYNNVKTEPVHHFQQQQPQQQQTQSFYDQPFYFQDELMQQQQQPQQQQLPIYQQQHQQPQQQRQGCPEYIPLPPELGGSMSDWSSSFDDFSSDHDNANDQTCLSIERELQQILNNGGSPTSQMARASPLQARTSFNGSNSTHSLGWSSPTLGASNAWPASLQDLAWLG